MPKIKPTDPVPAKAEWRPFPLNKRYLVSEYGHMTRIDGDGLLIPYSRKGYFTYSPMLESGRPRTFGCHVIVALCFVGPKPTPRHEVAHEDGDGEFCHFPNLRWATRKSNHHDKYRHGRMPMGKRNGQNTHPECRPRGEAHGLSVLTLKQVRKIRRSKGSHRKLAEIFKVSKSTISSVLSGATWRAA